MARSQAVRIILEALEELGEGTLDALFQHKYRHADWLGFSLQNRKASKKLPITRHLLSASLSRLKAQGLVERKGTGKNSSWLLSTKGITYFSDVKKKEGSQSVQKDGVRRLVIFDIPERERRKRDTIRAELVACRFQQLQKSVWIGEYPLPEDFIKLIDSLNLAKQVHIFSIRERGTITS